MQTAFSAPLGRALPPDRKVILHLCSALVRLTWSAVSSFGLPQQERQGHTRVICCAPMKGHKDDNRIGTPEKRLKELGLLAPGDLINMYQYLVEETYV